MARAHLQQRWLADDGVGDNTTHASQGDQGDEDDADDADDRKVDDDAGEERDLAEGAGALGGQDALPRLRVIARSGKAISQAVSQRDAGARANHRSIRHQRDDAKEEGEGDDPE